MSTRGTRRVTYANVVATLALVLALGGTAAAAGILITGADVKDRSLTGRDIADRSLPAKKLRLGSLTGALVRDGSLRAADFDPADLAAMVGPAGPAGPPGPKGDPGTSDIVRLSWSADDVTNYVNDTVLISQAVTADGGWLLWARIDVTNTGVTDERFDCGLVMNGQGMGGGGAYLPAGTTKLVNSVGFGHADPSQPIELLCVGGGAGTFDLANIRLSVAKLF